MARMPGPVLLDGGDAINRGLRAFLPLQEASGLIAQDISPYRLSSGLVNGRARVNSAVGKAYSVVSPNELLNVGGPASLATSNTFGMAGKTSLVAASIWAYFSGTSLQGALFKIGATTNGFGLGVGNTTLEGAGNNIIGLYENIRWINTSVTFAVGWHHLAMSIDASGYPSIYYDGRLIYSDTTGAPNAFTTGGYLGGYVGTARFFTGYLSNFRLWARSLRPAEVARLYRDPWAGTLRTRRRVLATSGTPHTATPGAGTETYAGQGATVKAAATLLPGAGAETYAGKQAAVTAGATVAVGAGTETYQGLGAGVTQPATVAVGAGLIEVLGLQAALGSGLSGRVVRRGRYRTWDDVPTELAPVVSLAENYADELAVQRAVDDALARFAAMKAKTSIARRERLVDDLKRAIVAAVEEAAEADDEDALIALL